MTGDDGFGPGAAPPTVGASSDRLRRHNLAVALDLVHGEDGLSRAELTRRTGLNRSTVAALVGELVDLGLVVERDPDARRGVGRPSPIVAPSPTLASFVVNPEIDALTTAVIGLGGAVLDRHRRATATTMTPEEMVAATVSALAEARSRIDPGIRMIGLGLAVPGLVRREDGVVRLAPHLGWREEPLAAMLETATGLPVVAGNDAALALRAEARFGAGRGVRDLVYVNGGASGIGGGALVGGVPLSGGAGYAGEIGHTLVDPLGGPCHCGARGCLETEVRRERLLAVLGLDDADDDALERALTASTDPAVRDEVARQLGVLADALRGMVNLLGPELVVLGGFLAALDAAQPGVLAELIGARALAPAAEGLRIARAELGSRRLLIGAAELVVEGLVADPSSHALRGERVGAIGA